MATLAELQTRIDSARDRHDALKREMSDIHTRAGDRALTDGETERWSNLERGVEKAESELAEATQEYRSELGRGLEAGLYGREGPVVAEPVDDRPTTNEPPYVRDARTAGLRMIERHAGALSAPAGDRLDALTRGTDPTAVVARYLTAVGEPAYLSAFGKLAADPIGGHNRFTPQEVAAVQRVSAIQQERAMSTTGSAGGYAMPFTLDPSVLLSSNGVLNPIRAISRVFTIATHDWKGVSSDGVTAAYVAEGVEATDASPVLAQPVITTAQGRAFIPFSIEIGQDWGSLQSELLRLIADGRDVLDSAQFLTGNGSNAPIGLLAVGTTGALTTSQRVQTATTATTVVADIYSLKQALAATRFAPGATVAAHPTVWDVVYRFTPSGSTTEPQIMTDRTARLLGVPRVEWSSMQTGTSTTGNKAMIVGDFANFYIADRLGMTAELIPHLFGATNRYPTGQRGLYAYWRTRSVVAVLNAFRYMETK